MAVTRLERKGRKNKTVAKVRVATIKRLKSKITIGSPNKEESGVIIGDAVEVMQEMNSKETKKAAKKEAPAKKAAKKEAPAKEETAVEEVKVEVEASNEEE